jgi:hypothetical protein
VREKGIAYEKVIAAHGSPIPFLRKASREDLRAATGDTPRVELALVRYASCSVGLCAPLGRTEVRQPPVTTGFVKSRTKSSSWRVVQHS